MTYGRLDRLRPHRFRCAGISAGIGGDHLKLLRALRAESNNMNVRRHLTKSRAGHWTLTLTNKDTGHKAYSDKHDTKHGALTEEDDLMARLQERTSPPEDQFLSAIGHCGK